MQLETNPTAAEVPGEKELLERAMRLHKRDDKRPSAIIGVKNAKGELRIKFTCHTESEESGLHRLLEDRKFTDGTVTEELDEDGNIEGHIYDGDHVDGYDTVYSPEK